MNINLLISCLQLLLGLALFLFGMTLLSESLEKLSGSKLERILEKLSGGKLRAFLLGFGVTCLIQSSSATTVMVVGFVNSGIMKLTQAAGIILGANIGTTATAWLLSLNSIGLTGFFQLLKPANFTPVLAIFGVILLMSKANEKKKSIAGLFIGFSILIIGMGQMSDVVEPLKGNETFQSIISNFQNPILGIITGMLTTMIIQSSSASIGIIQALAIAGLIPFHVAIPFIFGDNIGTCITSAIASIGTTRNAKRVAVMHFTFNTTCVILYSTVFFSLNHFLKFDWLDLPASPVAIAMIHSAFNIVGVLLWFPFTSALVWIARKIIPVTDEEKRAEAKSDEFTLIDHRFFAVKSFSIPHFNELIDKIAELSKNTFAETMALFEDYTVEGAANIKMILRRISNYEKALGDNILAFENGKEDKDLEDLTQKLSEFEGITKANKRILSVLETLFTQKDGEEIEFRNKERRDALVLFEAAKEITELTASHKSRTMDEKDAQNVPEVSIAQISGLDDYITTLSSDVKKKRVKRLRKGKVSIEAGFVFSEIATYIKTISSRCCNIAELDSQTSNLSLFAESRNYYDEYKLKYALKVDE